MSSSLFEDSSFSEEFSDQLLNWYFHGLCYFRHSQWTTKEYFVDDSGKSRSEKWSNVCRNKQTEFVRKSDYKKFVPLVIQHQEGDSKIEYRFEIPKYPYADIEEARQRASDMRQSVNRVMKFIADTKTKRVFRMIEAGVDSIG